MSRSHVNAYAISTATSSSPFLCLCRSMGRLTTRSMDRLMTRSMTKFTGRPTTKSMTSRMIKSMGKPMTRSMTRYNFFSKRCKSWWNLSVFLHKKAWSFGEHAYACVFHTGLKRLLLSMPFAFSSRSRLPVSYTGPSDRHQTLFPDIIVRCFLVC